MSKNNNSVTVTIDNISVIRILGLIVATILLVVFFKNIIQPLVLVLISFFLALGLNPAVSWISRKLPSKSRIHATGVAYIFVLTFLIAFFTLVIPPLVKQTIDFIKDVPSSIQEFKREDSAVNQLLYKYNLDESVDRFSSDFGSHFADIGKPALSTAGKIGSTVANTIIVLVLTFMMLVEGPGWLKRFWETQPASKRAHRKKLGYQMYRVVTNYVNGQVLIAALGGMFATIAVFILSQVFDASVNAIALGGIIAMFALLPLIGTTIGSVIVILACLLVSVPLAIAVALYFVIYQQIENVTIQPYIQARGNSLTPLIVFVAALLGVGFGGILGAFLAIPTAGCLKILIEDYYTNHRETKAKQT
jgi:predicted PurR-regulated permease PerM